MRWVEDQSHPQDAAGEPVPVVNLTYNNFPYKTELKDVLIGEQDARCAYTCRWITRRNARIEHIKPQSVCKQEVRDRGGTVGTDLGDDLEYTNMVAALKVEGANAYGEAVRGDWYGSGFVSPLDPSCERRLLYLLNGTVEPADEGAGAMIQHLDLNNETLQLDRAREIEGFFPAEVLNSITEDELRQIADGLEPPSKAPSVEFATVVRLVAQSLLP